MLLHCRLFRFLPKFQEFHYFRLHQRHHLHRQLKLDHLILLCRLDFLDLEFLNRLCHRHHYLRLRRHHLNRPELR